MLPARASLPRLKAWTGRTRPWRAKPQARFALVMAVVFAAVALTASRAEAGHIHTITEWTHGTLDATDDDKYQHPYNTNTANHMHYNRVALWRGVQLYAFVSPGTHNHFDWDTNPNPECQYSSEHWAESPHMLNSHWHYHHNGWC